LIVVQHNDFITAPVINWHAFANDMRNPRRYMIMDGHLIAMIFRDHDALARSTGTSPPVGTGNACLTVRGLAQASPGHPRRSTCGRHPPDQI
jgi:hypothetical protein